MDGFPKEQAGTTDLSLQKPFEVFDWRWQISFRYPQRQQHYELIYCRTWFLRFEHVERENLISLLALVFLLIVGLLLLQIVAVNVFGALSPQVHKTEDNVSNECDYSGDEGKERWGGPSRTL
ncbi:hypothetical protein PQR02_38545 [Paraburkholderia sediminicola]|uniref:Uncharacterized protein n=1 Tax=Paraburkholderia rhynchosiae TaxID=487049 RepID=A0ACC7NNM7_9BURK